MEERNRLLIVDDNKENVRVLIEILKRDYQLNAITDSYKVMDMARKWKPDVILLDVIMPGLSGYDICMQLKACDETSGIPVIFVTGISDIGEEIACISTGALDYVTKPINPGLLNARIKNFIKIKNDRVILAKLLESKRKEIDDSANYREDILAGINFSKREQENSVTEGLHVRRCAEYTKILVKALISNVRFSELLSSKLAENICRAAPYHDIGKAALPAEILSKDEKLTPGEFELNKTHVERGVEMVEAATADIGDGELVRVLLEMVRSHHERWDGTGYPEGLKGTEIPLSARIMAIADQYDALVSRRICKEPTYHFEAVRVIAAESGKGLDPELVREFLGVQEEILSAMQKFSCMSGTETDGEFNVLC